MLQGAGKTRQKCRINIWVRWGQSAYLWNHLLNSITQDTTCGDTSTCSMKDCVLEHELKCFINKKKRTYKWTMSHYVYKITVSVWHYWIKPTAHRLLSLGYQEITKCLTAFKHRSLLLMKPDRWSIMWGRYDKWALHAQQRSSGQFLVGALLWMSACASQDRSEVDI